MSEWSDGEVRPAWYDGTSLTRAIEDFFGKPRDAEIERLRRENKRMREQLAPPKKKDQAMKAAA